MVEERLKAISDARKLLMDAEADLGKAIDLLEPHVAPFIKGWLRSAKYRIYFVWSGPLSHYEKLR